ncbi:MAG: cobalamin B12-binding domain-containing protein [Candidatus Staskawiczbacteria bacterium]|nr:cobalamin B12-binding domain-containing protein [Candidatus Staskawiczbacteria bacterium]
MNNRILLINPPMTYLTSVEPIRLAQPMGLCYIAAVLEKEGYDVKILDAHAEGYHNRVKNGDKTQVGLTEQEISLKIAEFNPAIVGVGSMFSDQYNNSKMVCRVAKETNSEIVTCMGGVHPTMVPDEVLKDPNVNYVIRGEAEYSFRDFCDWLIKKKDINPKKIDGLNFNPKEQWIQNLDELPFPARHLLNLPLYFEAGRAYREPSKRKRAFPIITSRCCPAFCNFCATHTMQGSYRQRSVDNVIAEIEYLVKTCGMEEIYFLDDALAFGNFREILKKMVENKYDLAWHGANGIAIYSLDDELIDLFAKSGCYKVILSIESGVQKTLNYMRKPVKLVKTAEIIKKIKDSGLKVESMFVIGLPCESKEDILNTIKFAESLQLDYVSFPLATPFKGTDFYKDCFEKGCLAGEYKFENLKFGIGNIKTDEWGPEFVETVRKEAWHRINKIKPEDEVDN